MKAAQIKEYGGADKIIIQDIDKPALGEGQVMVEVLATSLNPFDTMIRSGAYKDMIPLDLPKTLGGDFAGKIVGVGNGVVDLGVGDTVYGQANVAAGNSGALAEFAVTKSNQLAIAPDSISIQQSASLPLVGVSALQALTDHIKLQADQKIFIHGGAGGIGAVAIQLAKHLGAYVATTATSDGINYVKDLGADEVIDYKQQDFSETLNDFDAVFDTVGGDDFVKSFRILKPNGIAVSMTAQTDEELAEDEGITAISQSTSVNKQRLDALRDLVDQGIIKPKIAKKFKFDEVQQAFEARDNGGLIGKIVITIK